MPEKNGIHINSHFFLSSSYVCGELDDLSASEYKLHCSRMKDQYILKWLLQQ